MKRHRPLEQRVEELEGEVSTWKKALKEIRDKMATKDDIKKLEQSMNEKFKTQFEQIRKLLIKPVNKQ